MSSSEKDAIRKAWHKVEKLGESSNTFNFKDDVVKDVIRNLYTELVDNHIYKYETQDRTEAYDDLILYYGKDKLDAIIKSQIAERIHSCPKFIFCNDQKIWHIGPAENTQEIKSDNIGFKYLHFLLSSAGNSISAIELYRGFNGVSEEEDIANVGGVFNDPLLDSTAEQNYKKRLKDIKIELEDATENLLTTSKIEELKDEQKLLLSLLKESRQNSRTTSDPNKEKSRQCIKSSIKQALDKIKGKSPETYKYLIQGVSQGHTLVYTAYSRFPVWELNKKPDM